MRPRLSLGKFLKARRVVGWTLILIFVTAPLIHLNGNPLMFLDVEHRKFYLFGGTFLPTDSFMLMLLMLSIFLGVFWLTALVGRAWCGWGCPQTVYMEFLFRPIERLFEGGPAAQRALDNKKGLSGRRVAKNAVFLVLSFLLANVFLAYFVSYATLWVWVTDVPWANPGGFGVVAFMTGLVFFDFAYFREQMCTVICPYARLQSGLLDRHSMVVGYDVLRGEARKKASKRKEGEKHGDCIDCNACVVTCPTGIDIRNGLQLECIACAQCADACDSIMIKVGKEPGLIRLGSQESLEKHEPSKKLRVRTVLYPVVIAVLMGALVFSLNSQQDADVTVLRGLSAPFVEDGTTVRNQLRVKVVNRQDTVRTFTISIPELSATQVIAPMNPLSVQGESSATTPVFVTIEKSELTNGFKTIMVHVTDGDTFEAQVPMKLLGPKGH